MLGIITSFWSHCTFISRFL